MTQRETAHACPTKPEVTSKPNVLQGPVLREYTMYLMDLVASLVVIE